MTTNYLREGERKPYNAWVSPEGEVFEVGVWGHLLFAINKIKERYNEEVLEGATEYLHQKGWARVQTLCSEMKCTITPPISPIGATYDIFHYSKKIYEGIYECYLRSGQFPEIYKWLQDQGYILQLEVPGIDIETPQRTFL